MKKFITFEEFAAEKAKKTQVQLEQELSTKREAAANSFKELLSEFGVASIGELSEEDRLKFNEKLGTLTESALLLEGTKGQFGIIDKRGNIQSVYTHYDSYPDNVLPLIKKHYKNSNDVNSVIAKGSNLGLDAPDKIKFYGNDLDPMTGKKSAIDSYLKKANDDGGAEYVYLYDEADKKWYMADIYGETGLVPAFESVVTEGKDDFMARYGSANINLKKGYKHHTEEELNDLYDKLGDLVKTLKVKDVTLVFESEVNEGARTYWHVIEDVDGEKGWQGFYNTKEEAEKRADSLQDMFPRSFFYVEASNSKKEPVDITLEGANEAEVSEGNDFGGPGLIVVGKTRKDNDLIDQATEESGFYGIYNPQEKYWFFPERGDQATIDKLENELETIFIKKGANVRYEAQYESVVNEAKGFKNTEDFKAFLKEIDGMGDAQIKKIMGKDYIDTPGYYSEEAEDYDNDIIEFMISNMGRKEFNKLQDYWENNVAESVVTERVSKIACLECDEVNTEKAWKKNKGFCPSCKTSTQGVAESVTESFTDPLEGFPQSYKDLLNKLQKSNDRSERYMLINKMNVIRKKLNLKPLKNESAVTEAKGFKSTKNFIDFLEEIDGMGDIQIKKIMGKNYIDTPGFYSEEAEDYDNDIIEFMTSNMGTKEFEKLQDYWENNVKESVVTESEIKSDDEFKEYAFTVLQKAFGDDFDEAKAQEVVDGILGKVDGDYGKAAGILQSSLG